MRVRSGTWLPRTDVALLGAVHLSLLVPLVCVLQAEHAERHLTSAYDVKPDGGLVASQDDEEFRYSSFSACVDGDPDFIVGVQGLEQPLCFRLEGDPGHVIRLLQDPDTGVVVNALITHPVPGSRKTYLGAVFISRRNFQVVARVGHVRVNSYRFAWGPTAARLVHGHRVLITPTVMAITLRQRNVTLVIKRHLPEGGVSGGEAFSDGDDSNDDLDDEERWDHRDNSQDDRAAGTDVTSSTNSSLSPENLRYLRHRHQAKVRQQVAGGQQMHGAGVSGQVTWPKPQGRQHRTSHAPSSFKTTTETAMKSTARHVGASRKFLQKDVLTVSPRRGQSTRRRQTEVARTPEKSKTQPRNAQRRSLTGHQQDNAAYMGFYVSDARDLSTDTHGLLGQFLHKAVSLQRVRRRASGRVKATLLVGTSQGHVIRASLRTRTNLVLNTSSTCWWVKDGGRGVVDGRYSDYLVSTLRYTDSLPLPPDLSQ